MWVSLKLDSADTVMYLMKVGNIQAADVPVIEDIFLLSLYFYCCLSVIKKTKNRGGKGFRK